MPGFVRRVASGTQGVLPKPPLAALVRGCVDDPPCAGAMSAELTLPQVRRWLRHSHQPPRREQVTHVWVWLEFAESVPRHVQLNLAALHRNAPRESGFVVVVLNSSTVSRWLSPLPPELERVMNKVALSDVARMGLLATHGGIYVDADVLVAEPLQPVAALLAEYEHVVYATRAQDCARGIFSSNFVAARPRSALWTIAYDTVRAALRDTCQRGRRKKHQVACCYAADSDHNGGGGGGKLQLMSACPTIRALTDNTIRPIAIELAVNLSLSSYCFQGLDTFAPFAGFRPGHFTTLEESCVNQFHLPTTVLGGCRACSNDAYVTRAHPQKLAAICCQRRGLDLVCHNNRGGRALALRFFDRVAYHLFESINGGSFAAVAPGGRIEDSNLSVAPLYRRALGLPW